MAIEHQGTCSQCHQEKPPKFVCDNCGHALRDEEDSFGNPPEKHAELTLKIDGKNLAHLILDVRCAKKYLRVLSDPI